MVEYVFWGITLSDAKRKGSWEVDLNRDVLSKVQYLTLRQVFLGEGVPEGEEHIVQMEVTGRNGTRVMPIVRLQQGSIDCCNPNIKFSDTPVKFTLLKGSGPVHLYGNHTFGGNHKIEKSDAEEEDEDEEVEEEEDDIDEADDEDEEIKAEDDKSAAIQAVPTPETKKPKTEDSAKIQEEDKEEEEEEEEKPKKRKKSTEEKKDKSPAAKRKK